jgi:hypothetical protein
MLRAVVLAMVVVVVGDARAETVIVDVGTDHDASAQTIAELRARPAALWGPRGLAPARAWLEDVVEAEPDPHVAARAAIADADDRFLKFDLDGALDKLATAERTLETATFIAETRDMLRHIVVRRAEIELAAKRTPRADGWLRLAVRLGATELDSKRFPPAVRARHEQALKAEKAAPRIRARIATNPADSVTCVDGAVYDGELVAGEHYLCLASPGYQSKILRQTITGDVKLELVALPLERAGRSLRAALQPLALDTPAALPHVRALARVTSAERLVLVRGSELFAYDVARDRVEPWQPATLEQQREETPIVEKPKRDRPLYKNPWVIGGVALGVVAATVAIVVFTTKDEYRVGDVQWQQ